MNRITENIYYIGADDRELDLFEGQYETPEGISYNSHVIVDQKIAVIDTIDARKADEWKANLAEVLGQRKPDYLIVSHMEPDHSSLVKEMIDSYPEMQVVCSAQAVKMMARFFGEAVAPERIITVKDNSTLSLGEHTLQFFTAGMVHWPEVIVEYEQKEKILFSCRRLRQVRSPQLRRSRGMGLRGTPLLLQHRGQIRCTGAGPAQEAQRP